MSPASPPQSYYQQPQYQQQQQYRPPPQQQQQYQPPPQQYQPPPQQYQPPPQQYQPPPPQQQQYVPTYQTVGDLQPDYVRAEDPVPEEDYEYTSVRDRKQQFADKPAQQPQIKRGKKKFVKPVSAGYESFGTDYSRPRSKEPEQQRFPQPPPPQQIPINRAPSPEPEDLGPKPWQGTLRSEGLKPWELEDREYIMPSQLEAMKQRGQHPRQKRPAPAVSPKPKPQTQHQIKVAPPQQTPPVRQISVRSVNNDEAADGPRAVHLQYNSPMGLYSRDNIDQTYSAQIQGQPEETSSTVSKPGQQQQQQGDRDWNKSYVYKMVKEETKRETQTYPGQTPVTTQTYSSRTYQTGQPPSEESYGISDF